jgi:hypothetical protein
LRRLYPAVTLDSVTAEIDADEVDPGVQALVEREIASRVHARHVEVKIASLHAGLKCCAANPPWPAPQTLLLFIRPSPPSRKTW